MKYVKLTGWGNNKNHLIPLKAINSFSEEDKYTAIRLDNGFTINVQESFSVIEELLDMAGVTVFEELDIIDKININTEPPKINWDHSNSPCPQSQHIREFTTYIVTGTTRTIDKIDNASFHLDGALTR